MHVPLRRNPINSHHVRAGLDLSMTFTWTPSPALDVAKRRVGRLPSMLRGGYGMLSKRRQQRSSDAVERSAVPDGRHGRDEGADLKRDAREPMMTRLLPLDRKRAAVHSLLLGYPRPR